MRGLEERLRLALEGTETGFWEWEIASDAVEWSENVGPMYGLPRGTQPAGFDAYLERCVDAADRAELRTLVRRAAEEGIPYEHDVLVPLPDGAERWLHSRVRVIEGPDGRPERLIGLLTDVTERRRREDAHAFLDAASQALAASLDPVQTLDEVTRLAVPRLADWCAVQLAADFRGSYEQVAVAHVDPEKVRWARELQQRYPPDPDAPTGAPAVIRTGRSELYPVIDGALLEAAALDEDQVRLVRELQMHSVMVVPLIARERTLGAITFVWAESRRQYDTRDLELASELGRRARPGRALGARPPRGAGARPRAALRPRAPRGRDAPAGAPPVPAARPAGLRARGALRALRRARPRRRRLVRRVRAARRALRDRHRRRRRARAERRGDDGPAPQRAARLRAQGRGAARGDGRPARARRPRGRRDHLRHRRLCGDRSGHGRGRVRAGGAHAAAARRGVRRRARLPAARLQR